MKSNHLRIMRAVELRPYAQLDFLIQHGRRVARKHLLSILIVALALGGLARLTAVADPSGTVLTPSLLETSPASPQQFHFAGCEAVVTPHKLLVLRKGIPEVHADSTGIDYIGKPLGICVGFVVDISVPSDSGAYQYASEFALGGRSPRFENYGLILVAEGQCNHYTEFIQLYRKASGETQFTKLGGGVEQVSWKPSATLGYPGCVLTPDSYFEPWKPGFFKPPASGTDTYRVAIGVKYGEWLPVEVSAFHFPIPE